jgi:type IV pilus biogenesis protein CpaD/CtpE
MKRLSIIIALAALPLAACTPNDTTFGGAFRHDMAMQTIDPDPEYEGELVEGGDGQRSAKAVERYRKGEVKQPVAQQTGGSGSGKGSGSGSSPNN